MVSYIILNCFRINLNAMELTFVTFGVILWVYGAVSTYVLGTQVGGNRRTWAVVGIFLGPLGMFPALIVPAFSGRFPKTTRSRIAATGLTFGLLVISETMLRSVGFGSAFFNFLTR
jgi:hypothetical protein